MPLQTPNFTFLPHPCKLGLFRCRNSAVVQTRRRAPRLSVQALKDGFAITAKPANDKGQIEVSVLMILMMYIYDTIMYLLLRYYNNYILWLGGLQIVLDRLIRNKTRGRKSPLNNAFGCVRGVSPMIMMLKIQARH